MICPQVGLPVPRSEGMFSPASCTNSSSATQRLPAPLALKCLVFFFISVPKRHVYLHLMDWPIPHGWALILKNWPEVIRGHKRQVSLPKPQVLGHTGVAPIASLHLYPRWLSPEENRPVSTCPHFDVEAMRMRIVRRGRQSQPEGQ